MVHVHYIRDGLLGIEIDMFRISCPIEFSNSPPSLIHVLELAPVLLLQVQINKVFILNALELSAF